MSTSTGSGVGGESRPSATRKSRAHSASRLHSAVASEGRKRKKKNTTETRVGGSWIDCDASSIFGMRGRKGNWNLSSLVRARPQSRRRVAIHLIEYYIADTKVSCLFWQTTNHKEIKFDLEADWKILCWSQLGNWIKGTWMHRFVHNHNTRGIKGNL